jgi:hypothetical protein
VFGSDESTPSPDEGQSLPYQESNLVHRCEVPTNLLIFFPYYFSFISNSCIFSQGSHITLMPIKIHTMVHHILRGRPLWTRTDIRAGEGEDTIIFPRWTIHLLKIQVAPHPMPMDLIHICPPDPSQLVQNVQWVYEYENPEFYNMLV